MRKLCDPTHNVLVSLGVELEHLVLYALVNGQLPLRLIIVNSLAFCPHRVRVRVRLKNTTSYSSLLQPTSQISFE